MTCTSTAMTSTALRKRACCAAGVSDQLADANDTVSTAPIKRTATAANRVIEHSDFHRPVERRRGGERLQSNTISAAGRCENDGFCETIADLERRLVRPARLERATSWFVARRSIQLSYGRAEPFIISESLITHH